MRSGWLGAACCCLGMLVLGCGIEPDRVFERNAPQVDRAIEALDAGEAGAAAGLLQGYLGTGTCEKGELGVSDLAKERKNASFDLGLTLFHFAEQFGPRFGLEDSELTDGGPTAEQQKAMELRGEQVTCALKLLRAIGASKNVPADLAARAKYLEGNLEFLRRNYREAVKAYDETLRLIPGTAADAGAGAGDEVGRDAAWNRAIALKRIQEENDRDAGQDASEDQDASQDTSPDTDSGSPDSGEDGPQEAGDEGQEDAPPPDAGQDGASDGGGDGGKDGGADGSSPEDQNKKPDSGAPDGGQQPPPEPVSQDERMLDMLEAAPTVQLEDARKHAARRNVRGMVDK